MGKFLAFVGIVVLLAAAAVAVAVAIIEPQAIVTAYEAVKALF